MHRFFDPDVSAESIRLPQTEHKHAMVLRIKPAEAFEITNGRGLCVTAEFEAAGENYQQLHVRVVPPNYPIHLIQALAKNDRDELAIQAATELGAIEFSPWQATRSIVQWAAGKAERNRDRWQQIALGAMKQSGRAWAPRVNPLVTRIEQLPSHGLLLAAGAPAIAEADLPATGCTLVVGPEGGITESESAELLAKGYRAVSINDAVLRTSTAGPAAIAIIAQLKSLGAA